MNRPGSKLARCAVYTRKSTDYNLDLAFNSLDAQREACEAYIKSQAHEGWRAIPDRYDDGAFSGASLERPALQQLLADLRAGKIEIVLVYKVDRLTRSLADFAKLIELFDAQGVSFVSVTQSFNTSSSMGRLTLNVLLSFAHFERELIGERVRDKIAASKRKGLWVGGPVPLGYAAVEKKIVVIPAEAEAVRAIFARYLAVGSIRVLAEELDRDGIRSKRRQLSSGRSVGGTRLGVGALAHLLKNRFYIGEVVYRDGIYRGAHEPILESAVFEAVQGKLAAQRVARRFRLRGSPAILNGRLFDICGNRMSPTHTNKRGVRYRYYVAQAVLQGKQAQTVGSLDRVPAAELEAVVVTALRRHLLPDAFGHKLPETDLELLERHLERVTVSSQCLELHVRQTAEPAGADDTAKNDASIRRLADATTITVPWTGPVLNPVGGIIRVPTHNTPMKPSRRENLLIAITKARGWADELASGRLSSFAVLARREGRAERHIRLLLPLAFVSPRVVSNILEGTAPAGLTITRLARALPWSWAEQERRLALRGALRRRGACAERRRPVWSLLSPASAIWPPRGFGGGGAPVRRFQDREEAHVGLHRLPATVVFCDVETTGLRRDDRMVSFGAIGMISRDLPKGPRRLAYLYLVFDPGTANRLGAEQIHGFSDSTLRLQEPFAMHAAEVRRFLTSYDLIVAHNAAFDIRFINRELTLSGLPALTRPVYCTMKGYRTLDHGDSASLSAICRHIKLARAGDLHNAIEDAWLAMQIYLWLHGCPLQRRLRDALPRTPSNLASPYGPGDNGLVCHRAKPGRFSADRGPAADN